MAKKKALTPITEETREEAYIAAPKEVRKSMILRVLGSNDMTAREIAYKLGYQERNAVAPRLTEMVAAAEVFVSGKKLDSVTGRMVATYRRLINE